MPPEALARPSALAVRLESVPAHWRATLGALGATWLVLILAFLGDWADMARQWWDSSTYNHILLVPLIVGWLVWQRLGELAKLRAVAWSPGLVLFGGAMLLWVLGAFAGLSLARQAGAVGVLIASAITLLGPRVSVGLAFPLAYMTMLVPFGDELVPLLQMITAVLTIALTEWSGIPAAIDGVFIDTPAGLFEVAEACSGVKFLIAMIAFGLLTANVCFTSWKRRVVFMVFCLAVPILANGVRAWATILAAQYVGAEKATGFDHIVYGWFFFAFVIALVLAGAWRFFDRDPAAPMIEAERIEAIAVPARLERLALRLPLAVALLALLLAAGQGWARAADAMEADLPPAISLPQVPGWTRVDYTPRHAWEPRASGAAHRLLGRYRNAEGREVDVFYALYAHQRDGSEAGGFGEGALQAEQGWSWKQAGPPVRAGKSDRLLALGRIDRLAQTHYRNGDLLTGSNARLKLSVMADRVALRRHPTMLVILSAEDGEGHDAAGAIAAFRRDIGPFDQWIDRIAGLR
jgi:exosortase A